MTLLLEHNSFDDEPISIESVTLTKTIYRTSGFVGDLLRRRKRLDFKFYVELQASPGAR